MKRQDEDTGAQSAMSRVRRSTEEARTAYDRMSAWYDRLGGSSEQSHIDAGLQLLDAQPGERILDIGSGTGYALESLVHRVGSAGRVYGLDISEGMISVARTRLHKSRIGDRVDLVCGDGARLPLQSGQLHGVFMSFTLELFDTPRVPLVLQECTRVLAEAGRLCVVSLSRERDAGLPVQLYEWVHGWLPQYVDCRPIPVERTLREAGFEPRATEKRSMWGLPIRVVLSRPGHENAAVDSGYASADGSSAGSMPRSSPRPSTANLCPEC